MAAALRDLPLALAQAAGYMAGTARPPRSTWTCWPPAPPCDMYGRGVAGDRERVMATLIGLRDAPDRLARRAAAGLGALSGCAEVNGHLAAVGFCFGGMAALTLARSGATLDAVVSMHGSLATTKRAEPGAVAAKVLVCHGALDPHVPVTDVVAFTEEMTKVGADWQVNVYGGAMHGFTHGHAVEGAIPGVAYHAETDAVRSRPRGPSWPKRSLRSKSALGGLTRFAVARHDPGDASAAATCAGKGIGSMPDHWSFRALRGCPANSPRRGDRSCPRCPGR